jgi:hypothetical protein
MTEIVAPLELSPEPPPRPAPAPAAPGLREWLREGLRAGVFLRPRTAGWQPGPRELAGVLLVAIACDIVLGRLEVPGAATFSLRGWLAPWWGVAASMLLVWSLLSTLKAPRDEAEPAGLASWLALWLVAAIPATLVSEFLTIAQAREALPPWLAQSGAFAWATYVGLWAWTVGVATRLGWHFGLRRRRLAGLAAGLFGIFAIGATQFPDRPWQAVYEAPEEAPQLTLSQEAFEAQQALWDKGVQGLAPQRPGVADVYGIVFAPYATEDVFLRESTMVAGVLAQRFDAQGRVLQLANHATTADSLPWATPLNLKRAIDAVAARMDRDEDVLVVYLTSHGASDFQLAAAHPPLHVDSVTPTELRKALDEAGIKHRVVAISACFSGGWVGPLASDGTLVMTAADATHTSYGCGRLSELTFFGRAMFDEQLRKTHSFETAFAAAVPVIKQREIEGNKPDGFSNPQISVGAQVRPLLQALEQRLDAASAAAPAKP